METKNYAKFRVELIEKKGGKCEFPLCVERDKRVLELDHIHGVGGEREEGWARINGWYRKIVAEERWDEARVLCKRHHMLVTRWQTRLRGGAWAEPLGANGSGFQRFRPTRPLTDLGEEELRSRTGIHCLPELAYALATGVVSENILWSKLLPNVVLPQLISSERRFELLLAGGACKDCGEANPLFLEIDHINGRTGSLRGATHVLCGNCHKKRTYADSSSRSRRLMDNERLGRGGGFF